MFGLSFLVPAFLVGVVAAAVPLVLHLMRREAAPRISFSAVRFLKRAPVERTERRNLRELLLLALRVTALLLLVFAFARPYVTAGATASGRVAIVAVDTSFSMSAPGQFARARELARESIEATPSGALLGVVAFDDRAELVAELSTDRRTALSAIDELGPGFGATRYRTVIDLSASVIGSRAGQLAIVSDLQRSGWEAGDRAALPESVTIDLQPVDAPSSNLAVSAVERRAGEIVATIANGGTRRRSTRAFLEIDSRRIATQQLEIPAFASGDVRFVVSLPATGSGMVEIDDAEGYVADNTRYFVLDPPDALRVVAVTRSGAAEDAAFYLERVLLATREPARIALETTASQTLASRGSDVVRGAAVVILLSTQGLDQRARELLAGRVREGAGLLAVAGPDVDPAFVDSLLADQAIDLAPAEDGTRSLAPADARHPIFRPFGHLTANLGQIRFRRTTPLTAGDVAQVIGRFDDGTPALVECSLGTGRVLVFGSDLNNAWNDFPRQASFVPFVHEVVRYLAGDPTTTHDFIVGRDPEGAPREPGVVMTGDPPRRVAVNVDPRESESASLSADEFRSAIRQLPGVTSAADAERREEAEREERQGLWRYGLAVMVLVLLVEGFLGRRMARTG